MPVKDLRPVMEILQRPLGRDPSGKGRASLPVAWASTKGAHRQENQDRLAVAHLRNGLAIAALADGMGGMKDGARAAALTLSSLLSFCAMHPELSTENLLIEALSFSNRTVFNTLRGEGGATVVVAAWTATSLHIAHAGDSRAYSLPEAAPLHKLTDDDTVGGQLEKLGRQATADAELHRRLLQFVGVGDEFQPHVTEVVSRGRGLMLTTDGAHAIPFPIMEWLAASTPLLQPLAERIVTASEWNGGRDNGTVIVVSFHNSPSSPHAPLETALAEVWIPGDHILVMQPQHPSFYSPEQKSSDGNSSIVRETVLEYDTSLKRKAKQAPETDESGNCSNPTPKRARKKSRNQSPRSTTEPTLPLSIPMATTVAPSEPSDFTAHLPDPPSVAKSIELPEPEEVTQVNTSTQSEGDL